MAETRVHPLDLLAGWESTRTGRPRVARPVLGDQSAESDPSVAFMMGDGVPDALLDAHELDARRRERAADAVRSAVDEGRPIRAVLR